MYLNYCLILLLNDLPYLSNLGRPTAKDTSGEKNKIKKEKKIARNTGLFIALWSQPHSQKLIVYVQQFHLFIYLFIELI